MKFKGLLISTILYLMTTLGLIFFLTTNLRTNDTNRVVNAAELLVSHMKEHPNDQLPLNVVQLPAASKSQATQTIKSGASFAREIKGNNLTVTVPVNKDGQIQYFIQTRDVLTPNAYLILNISLFSFIIYTATFVLMLIRRKKLKEFTEATVAKIKNIERSPLSQSYIIMEKDDKITIALNNLGETILEQASSHVEKKENLYEFIEFFQFPIFIYNSRGAIRKTNASFKNEFSDTENLDIFSPYSDFMTFLVGKMMNPTMQEKIFHFENIAAYYQVRITPLEEHDIGQRFMVTMLDVTSYKRTVIAHNEFIANVSHEFKTPLTSIKGFSEILLKEHLESPEVQKFAGIIDKETSRMMDLVQDTMLLTKQNQRIEKKKINLADIAQQAIENLNFLSTESGIQINTDLNPLSLKTNEAMVYSIFKNLIENAIKYTSTTVYIGLHERDGRVHFTTSDNGPGLSELEKSRIFERFYRADNVRSSTSGTGLGLSIVEKNVQDLHAHIDVVSALGLGTTFTVSFPKA